MNRKTPELNSGVCFINMKPKIIVDSREKHPWSFENSVTKKLEFGDYSIEGYEKNIAIERKTLDDFVGSVIQNWERFKEEIKGLSKINNSSSSFARIVIEGSIDDILLKKYTSSALPQAVLGRAISIEIDYGVPIIWAGSRQLARFYVDIIFEMFYKRIGTK